MSEESGTISVLNVGAGDMKFSFNSEDPLESARAQRCVEDMLRRGYLLFVKDKDGKTHRVFSFDPKTSEYIVADGPGSEVQAPVGPEPVPATKRGRGRPRRIPAASGSAVAVPKTAGG